MREKVFDWKDVKRMLKRMAAEVLEKMGDVKRIGVLGIRTGGVPLAKLLMDEIRSLEGGVKMDFGILDITLYRDDVNRIGYHPLVKETNIPFNLEDVPILLVDDVIYTGRTVRAAMDAIMDIGRPKCIKLATLIDRGGRELPIHPDVCGARISVGKRRKVVAVFEGKERGVYIE